MSDDARSSFVANLGNATERDPLLSQSPGRVPKLPPGWKTVVNEQEGSGLSCYEDEFSRSVTLTRPTISPIAMHQVQVGQLREPSVDELVCHVDLLSCLRAGDNEAEQLKLEKDLHDRFPYYDDAWYAEECDKEPNTNDVLGRIWMPWRIRTFGQFLHTRTGEEMTRGAILMMVSAVNIPLVAYIIFRLLGEPVAAQFCISTVVFTVLSIVSRLHRRGVWSARGLWQTLRRRFLLRGGNEVETLHGPFFIADMEDHGP